MFYKTNFSIKSQHGAAVLIITVILLVAAVSIILYSTIHSRLEQKTATNQLANEQAFYAAEAGVNFGLQYLNQNTSTVIASPSGGYINYGSGVAALTAVSLSNGTSFTVTFTNPTASNYQLLKITSVGTSPDGTSTRTSQQLVYQGTSYFTSSVTSRGNVTLVGGSTITNTVTNINIETGGTVTINNGASTVTSSGASSSQGNIKSDIVQNVTSLQTTTESSFFQQIFGASESTLQSAATATSTYYNNTVSGGDYSQTLSGMTNKTIYINQTNGQTVNLGQGVTIGTASNPVTLIVEGDLNIANGVTIYGFVYSSGPTNGFSLAGGAKIIGGIATAGTMNISNGFQLTYNKFPLVAGGGSGSYARVAGSWRDF